MLRFAGRRPAATPGALGPGPRPLAPRRSAAPSDDGPPSIVFGKGSVIAYLVVLGVLTVTGVEVGEVQPASAGGAAVFALIWFGGGMLLEGLWVARAAPRGSEQRRFGKIWAIVGAAVAALGAVILVLVTRTGVLLWVGAGLVLAVCFALGGLQHSRSMLAGLGWLLAMFAVPLLFTVVWPSHAPTDRLGTCVIHPARTPAVTDQETTRHECFLAARRRGTRNWSWRPYQTSPESAPAATSPEAPSR